MFDDTVIDKCKFHYSKYPIDIKKVHINKTLIFNKISKKVINTGFNDVNTVKPLGMMLPKLFGFAKKKR